MTEINGWPIGAAYPPYIIAEACNNFQANMAMAKAMVREAKEAGCDAIKFQMRLQEGRITPMQHKELQAYCKQIGITYLCTAFDEHGLLLLREMGVAAIKIGSAECINGGFRTLARRVCDDMEIPLIISTGGCEWTQVDSIAMHADILMHCTSIYPTPYNKVNLDLIGLYGIDYHLPIGLSDHTPTIWTALGAVALGARVIEKHLMLAPSIDGPDVTSSIMPSDMRKLVEGAHAIYQAGGMEKRYHEEERFKLEAMRK